MSPGIYCMKKLFYYKRNRKDKSIVGVIKAYHFTKHHRHKEKPI